MSSGSMEGGRVTRAQLAESEHWDGPSQDRDRDVPDNGIRGQLLMLTDQMAKVHAVFNELANRIDPVLRPDMNDENARPTSEPSPPKSEVLLIIEELHSQVRRLQYRISEIHERVQL